MSALKWTSEAWEEYLSWQKNDKNIARRINELIESARRTPFSGIGKPKMLRHSLSGLWSRRIDQEHRLVYSYDKESDTLVIVQCRFHYK